MVRVTALSSLILAAVTCSSAWAQESNDAPTLYSRYCALCHDDSRSGAPSRESLLQRTPEAIYEALRTGRMSSSTAIAGALTDSQKRLLAEHLAGRPLGKVMPNDAASMTSQCTSKPLGDPLKGPRWNGWGSDLYNTRYQPAAIAGLTASQVPQLKLKWAFGLPNSTVAYAQPVVAGGRVYVGTEAGYVYSLDAATGCVYWSFEAKGSVRTAVVIERVPRSNPARYAAYFADQRANVYAVDAATGKQLWTDLADTFRIARITGSPVVFEGRLYVGTSAAENSSTGGSRSDYECCKYRGSVVAYDAATGKRIWMSYTIPEEPRPTRKTSTGVQLWGPAGASIWSAPTIDAKRRQIIVTTGEGFTEPAALTTDAVIAMDLATGRIKWAYQGTTNDAFIAGCPNKANEACPGENGPDFDFGSSAILRTLPNGRDILIATQKSGMVHAVDPANGKLQWQFRVGKGSTGGGIEWGAAADEEMVFVPNADTRFGPAEAGGLTAIRLDNGQRVWAVRPTLPATCDAKNRSPRCSPAQSAAVTAIPGVVFSGALSGILQAYSTVDGRSLWEYDTVKDYETVNGVPGKGGSINGPGPAVVGGTLFVNSGYGKGGVGGNVLLAFAAE
jgi:polyvinyl alcohol dehydrogenase (cytochrome)